MTELPEFDDVVGELLARQPEHDMVPTLRRVEQVMDLLGDPQLSPRVVHITGTNGKTSTARMIEALVMASGLRVGTFTSPHLQSVTERIRVDGEPISQERFVATYEEILPMVAMVDRQEAHEDHPPLTFFEVLTCLAFAVFADAPVDVAVVEVGLGGRWDATNVVEAEVAVITPIAVDHEHWLGSTVEQIASEKAGVIKAGTIAIIGHQQPQVTELLLRRCAEVGAEARLVGRHFGLDSRSVAVGGQVVSLRGAANRYQDVFLCVMGPHQADNAVLAVAAAEGLLVGDWPLETAVVDSLGSVTSPGRLEAVAREPTVLLDAAHNPAGAAALAAALADSYSFADVIAVIGVMADKDVVGMLRALAPVVGRVIASAPDSARALPASQLGRMAEEAWDPQVVTVIPDLAHALATARAAAAQNGGAVLVTGSVVTVGQARAILLPEGDA